MLGKVQQVLLPVVECEELTGQADPSQGNVNLRLQVWGVVIGSSWRDQFKPEQNQTGTNQASKKKTSDEYWSHTVWSATGTRKTRQPPHPLLLLEVVGVQRVETMVLRVE